MKALLQRVNSATVRVDGMESGSIEKGLVVFLGVMQGDTPDSAEKLANKTASLRIFADADRSMNCSVREVGGSIMVISQFTLAADTSRGNRPSFSHAESPTRAKELYEHFVRCLANDVSNIVLGSFGEHMQVELENDGPVTILLEFA